MSDSKEVRTLIGLADRDYSILQTLLVRIEAMSVELDALRQEVAESRTVTQSAIELIQGLRNELATSSITGMKPAEVQALVKDLDDNTNALAAAVAANTRVDPVAPVLDAPREPILDVPSDVVNPDSPGAPPTDQPV